MTDRRSLFVLILAITGTGIMGNTLLAPAIPDILDEFGVADAGAGLLIAATSFPGIFMAPVIGRARRPARTAPGAGAVPRDVRCVRHRRRARPVVRAGCIVARFGMGIGAAGLINLAVVLIGDHWGPGDRTR